MTLPHTAIRHSAIGWGLYIKLHRDEVKSPGASVLTHSVLVEDVWTFERPYPRWSDTYQPCALAINLNYPCPINTSAYHVPAQCAHAPRTRDAFCISDFLCACVCTLGVVVPAVD